MPELRLARKQLAAAQREVAVRTKLMHSAQLTLAMLLAGKGKTRKAGANKADVSKGMVTRQRAALAEATRMLKAATKAEAAASRRLAAVIASEAARSSAETKARTLALYQQKQEKKSEADLRKALAKFAAVWKKRRDRVNARRLAKITRKASAKVAQARKKANAKARVAVEKAAALAKARARKAVDKTRAKAAKLKVRIVG